MISVVPGDGGFIHCGASSDKIKKLSRDDFISYSIHSNAQFRIYLDDLEVVPVVGLCAQLRFAAFKLQRSKYAVDWCRYHDLSWDCFGRDVIPDNHPARPVLDYFPKCSWQCLTYLTFKIFDPVLWPEADRAALLPTAKSCAMALHHEFYPKTILDKVFEVWLQSKPMTHK